MFFLQVYLEFKSNSVLLVKHADYSTKRSMSATHYTTAITEKEKGLRYAEETSKRVNNRTYRLLRKLDIFVVVMYVTGVL